MNRITFLLLLLAVPGMASATTYQVGPTRAYSTLTALFNAASPGPGDIVEVDPAVYTGGLIVSAGGAAGNPLVIHGVRGSNGARPRLDGGTNVIEFRLADHVVLEGFEITGASNTSRCVYHHSDDLTLRDVVVHSCPGQGIASSDQDSGSLTVEYSEVYDAGSGTQSHPLYVASDEIAHPGSVFRLRYSYIHGGNGGNLIKSRFERNEIYYNWLEGGYYRELELIGPDPDGASADWNENLVREDSDVVGNVIVHTSSNGSNMMRLGGDGGGGQTNGRYRFVNNTLMFHGVGGTAFQPFAGIESIEMDNNVLWGDAGSAPRIMLEDDAAWVGGISRIIGSNNWIQTGSTYVPSGWSGSFSGSDPGLSNTAASDLHPAAASPLRDHGTSFTVTPGYDIANPLFPPAYEPAARVAPTPGAAPVRVRDATIDIGAYEFDNGESGDAPIFSNGFDS
jgi:hypothetical protein